MRNSCLFEVGGALVRRCGTRNPFRIAKEIGIEVLFCENFGTLKGMYRVIKRNRFIFINRELSEPMRKIVCAHEIGHDQLHRDLAKDAGLLDYMQSGGRSVREYEANTVAAEILLGDEEILQRILQYGDTAEQAAKALGTDVNLVALKIEKLRRMGYAFCAQDHNSAFLK